MSKRKRSMHCPNCGSKKTKKNGQRKITVISFDRRVTQRVQRYSCTSCGKSFSKRREKSKKYCFGFKKELSRRHIEERQSYRVMSKRIEENTGKRISPTQVCKMVNEIAEQSKGSLEIKNEYNPDWEGHLVVDDKYINIKGEKKVSLIAVDISGYIVHEELLSEGNQSEYDEFFKYIKEVLKYTIKSVTTDLDEMLEKSIRRIFGEEIPHQKCIWHAMENIRRIDGYKEIANKYRRFEAQIAKIKRELEDRTISYQRQVEKLRWLEEETKEIRTKYTELSKMHDEARKIFYSNKRDESNRRLTLFKRRYSNKYPQVINFIKRNYNNLITYQTNKGIPKTSNTAENINRQIVRRFKTIEAFQTVETAFNYLNLICNYLRFKPYTDCKGNRKNRNKKSPIELCGVKLNCKDWIKNSVRVYGHNRPG